ncbi:MAG: sel1 repeat family protein, partial [Burkholderiales bacterium]|nr:sel1 repeat family protein [Burkholderiales bacterium]
GTAYYLGRGLPLDPAQAAHWYRAAALGGDVGAMYLLASMYEHGDGVAADLRLARYWYDQGAQAGDLLAAAKAREMAARLAAADAAGPAPAATARP